MSKQIVHSVDKMHPGDVYVSIQGEYPFWKDDKGRIQHINLGGGGWQLNPAANTLMFPAFRVFRQPRYR